MKKRLLRLILSLLFKLFVVDWQHKLRVVFAGIMIWQFIEWFDAYWLNDTSWLVRGAVVAVVATEFFTRVRAVWRHIGCIAALVSLHIYRLDIEFLPVPIHSGWQAFVNELGSSIVAVLNGMSPYLWFALATAVVHLAAANWLNERVRILVVTVVSVIVIALVDSYSKHIMWDQAAYLIFSGLGLIIVKHYDDFRRKHPSSWEYLTDYPERVAVPAVLIISIVMIAGAMAPNARPLLTDPYTLYMHWRGEQVVTGGKGFAAPASDSLFPALNTSSGYGRDDGELGGGFDFDYSEVMRITTSHRSYWRGETKSLYTGDGWLLSEADVNPGLQPVTAGEPLPAYDWGVPQEEGAAIQVTQTVMMTSDEQEYPVLFGAYPIQSVRIVNAGGNDEMSGEQIEAAASQQGNPLPNAAWSAKQGELRWGDSLPYPDIYEVVSAVPVTDLEAWRSVPQQAFENEALAPYLQLPDTLPDRVRELAEDVTREAETPYDKVKSIEAYLQTNYLYNNQPDLSKGTSEDFVDRFLFEMKEGYCDYYSTAMAVMVRSIGLPARWVKGFKSGVNEVELMFPGGSVPEDLARDMVEGGAGTYVVRNSDAHSWVEVYFPGHGWLPFEPTSGHALPMVSGVEEALETLAELELNPIAGESGEPSLAARLFTPIVLLSTAGILLLASLWIFVWRTGALGKLRAFRLRAKEEHSLNQQVLLEITRIFKLFGRKGYTRGAHETARESFARWTEQNKWLKKDLDRLLAILERARYSPAGVTADDFASVMSMRERIKEELK